MLRVHAYVPSGTSLLYHFMFDDHSFLMVIVFSKVPGGSNASVVWIASFPAPSSSICTHPLLKHGRQIFWSCCRQGRCPQGKDWRGFGNRFSRSKNQFEGKGLRREKSSRQEVFGKRQRCSPGTRCASEPVGQNHRERRGHIAGHPE